MKEMDIRLVLVLVAMSVSSVNTQFRKGFKLHTGKVWSDDQCDLIQFYISSEPDDCIQECSYYPDCTAFNFIGAGCVLRKCPLPVPEPEDDGVDYFNGYSLDEDTSVDQSNTISVSNSQQNSDSQSVLSITSAPISQHQLVKVGLTNKPISGAQIHQPITLSPNNQPISVTPIIKPIAFYPANRTIEVVDSIIEVETVLQGDKDSVNNALLETSTNQPIVGLTNNRISGARIIQPITLSPNNQPSSVTPIIKPIAFYPDDRTSEVVHPISVSREIECVAERVQSNANDTLVKALHAAAEVNLPDVVNALLNAVVDKNAKNDKGMTPLYVASWFDNLAVVQKLIEHDADVNIQANNGSTPLMVATWKGNINIVKALLDANANTELSNLNKETVLHNAAAYNRPNIARLLLQKGVDTSKQDKWGLTPEELAIQQGSSLVADIIRDYSSTSQTNQQTIISSTQNPLLDLSSSQSSTGNTLVEDTTNQPIAGLRNKPIANAPIIQPITLSPDKQPSPVTPIIKPIAFYPDDRTSEVVVPIREVETVTNQQTIISSTPKPLSDLSNSQSSTSASVSESSMVTPSDQSTRSQSSTSFLDSESSIVTPSNQPISSHVSPSVLVSSSQSSTSVSVSESIVVTPTNESTTVTNYGGHELWNAAERGDISFVNNSIESETNLNWKNPSQNYSTALHVASDSNYTEIVSALLEAGAEKDIVNDKGMTPLYLASWSGNTDVVNILIDHDVDVDIQAYNGSTPLMVATWKGHLDIVEALLEANANTTLMNINNETALHNAADYNRPNIARLLLEEGIDTSEKDKWGLTPEERAKEQGNHEVESIIMNFGSIPHRTTNNTAEET